MKTVKTLSGSIYEVDENNKRVRRIFGTNNPTPRQGNDGDWRNYEQLHLTLGNRMLVIWGQAGNIIQTTSTSTVMAIFEGEKNETPNALQEDGNRQN